MRLAVPVSNPVLLRTEVAPTTVVLDSLLGVQFGGAPHVRELIDKGHSVFQFGGDRVLPGSNLFAFGMDSFDLMVKNDRKPFGVVVRPEVESKELTFSEEKWCSQYERAADNPDVKMIAICCGPEEFSRLQYVSDLVHSGKFSKKPHCLYGFYNPAEISVYKKLFMPFILSRFEIAVCSSSFLYGVYCVPLSTVYGIHLSIPGLEPHRVHDLGMGYWIGYDLNRDQLRTFFNNVDTVQGFAQGGIVADGYVQKVDGQIRKGGSM